MSPSLTGTESEPVALFCCVSKVYTPLIPYCGGSYTQPSLVWYVQVKSIVSTLAGIVVSIFIQFAPGQPPSGPCKMMVLSMTCIEAVAQDCDASHSPSVSALAGLANKANAIAGIRISHLLRKLPLTHGTCSVPQLYLPRHNATTLFALFS